MRDNHDDMFLKRWSKSRHAHSMFAYSTWVLPARLVGNIGDPVLRFRDWPKPIHRKR